MDKVEWINQAKTHKIKLLSLILQWHPATRGKRPSTEGLLITALGAEYACQQVRAQLYRESDPAARFELALETSDVGEVYSVLSGAWFGVPESTSCWSLEGFKEAVDLMDDMPDQEEEVENGQT